MSVKKYSGNKPSPDYELIGSFYHLNNEWFIYKKQNKGNLLLIKVFPKNPVEIKANYWLFFDKVFKERGRDYFTAKEHNPKILTISEKLINQYLLGNVDNV